MTANDPTWDGVLTPYFKLEIDTYDLGVFTTCSGLGMEMSVEEYEEGGGGMYVYQLMGNFKYTPLQVSRPIGPWTANTMAWLNMMAQAGAQGVQPTTARLSALDNSGDIVFAWSLQGVIPSRWTGPSFDVNNLQQATETLELVYTAILLDPSDTSGDLFNDALP